MQLATTPTARDILKSFTRILGNRYLSWVTALALSVMGILATIDSPRLAPASIAPKAPVRIVALGGAITEILYALDLSADIVGVDTTSLYPAEALKTKANIGYFRAFSAEGVLSLKPSLVIAAEEAGPPDAIKLIEGAGVKVVRLSDEFSPEGVEKKIETIGHLVHAEDRAAQLSRKVADGFQTLRELRTGTSGNTRALLVLAMPGGRPLVAGRGTAADAMIKLAGGVNVAENFAGYKQMTDEAIVAAKPDVIVMMGHSGQVSATELFGMPAFATTPAAARHRLVIMDGLVLLGFGPRTPQAAKELLTAFYPASSANASGRKE